MKRNIFAVLLLVIGTIAGYALAHFRVQRAHRALWIPVSEESFTHDIESAHNSAAALTLLRESKPEEAIAVLDASLDRTLKSLAAGEIKVGSELHGVAAASVGPTWQRTMLEPAIDYRMEYPSESPGVNGFCTRTKQLLKEGA